MEEREEERGRGSESARKRGKKREIGGVRE